MAKLLYMVTYHSQDYRGNELFFTIPDNFYEDKLVPLGVLGYLTIQVYEMTGIDWNSRHKVNSPCLLHTQEFRQSNKDKFEETLKELNLAIFGELEGWG